MWLKWLPWRTVVRRVARAHGLVDPIAVLSRLHGFAKPSEVAAPMELLRAGVLFHARGLMNTGAIQHNLDWVWPYWVDRQFDPHDPAFIPRAFSITHVNLTHRNWTAIGVPGCDAFPIVDPRGLLTPHWDGWSIDVWLLTDDGQWLIPAQRDSVEQRYEFAGNVSVRTKSVEDDLVLETSASVELDPDSICRQEVTASMDRPGWLIISLRPYNPEGVSFIHDASVASDRRSIRLGTGHEIFFSQPLDQHALSTYEGSDVHANLPRSTEQTSIECNVGMVTAAAMFRLEAGVPRHVTVDIPLEPDLLPPRGTSASEQWQLAMQPAAKLRIPDKRLAYLYECALRTLVLHSPDEVYPGPYTYKRFWYRDAAFIVHGLACAGLIERAERAIRNFPKRQTHQGYFCSQEGEWDSNGQVLWTYQRWCELSGREPLPEWKTSIQRGAHWIERKRTDSTLNVPHAGLLPAGFSAEHLGPNDFYYWDDYWSVAGLHSAAWLLQRLDGDQSVGKHYELVANDLLRCIQRSLTDTASNRSAAGIPASPYRRMDAGAIGSIVGGYPLDILAEDDPDLLATIDFLRTRCFVDNGFFQDMIHSGVNAYLTLQVAQILLRAGNPDYFSLMEEVADLAMPTGTWPEAIHPRTGGGCMGDGHHVWAAAEWVMMMRNCFIREERSRLIVASGIPEHWLDSGEPLQYGPAPTRFGDVTVTIEQDEQSVRVRVDANWRQRPESVELRLAGFEVQTIDLDASEVVLEREVV